MTSQPLSAFTGEISPAMNMYKNVRFLCQTSVIGFKFYATSPGIVYVLVMRQVGTSENYEIRDMER